MPRKMAVREAYDPLAWLVEQQAEVKADAVASLSGADEVEAVADAAEPDTQSSATSVTQETKEMSKSEPLVIDLGSECSVRNIADLQARLQQGLSQNQELQLDPSSLQKIDTAGLQLLHNLRRHLQAQDKTLSWQQGSSVLVNAAAQLGLEDFGCGEDPPDQGFGFF